MQPYADVLFAVKHLAAFNEAQRDMLRTRLGAVLAKANARLNTTFPGSEDRRSTDVACAALCQAVVNDVLSPVLAELWSAVDDCMDAAGEPDNDTLNGVQRFGDLVLNYLTAWLGQRTFYALCLDLGPGAEPRIRELINDLLSAFASTPYRERFTTPLYVKMRRRDAKREADSARPSAARDAPAATKREQRAKWLAEAMLLVRDHPRWSDRAIAKHVGKAASTLTRSPEYQTAAAMARGEKEELPQGHIEVDPDTGQADVEAYVRKIGEPIPGSRFYRGRCPECGEETRVESQEFATTMPCERCR